MKEHFNPYKVSLYKKRTEYCTWFNNNLVDGNLLDIKYFTDKA